jgi:hypothetical protein
MPVSATYILGGTAFAFASGLCSTTYVLIGAAFAFESELSNANMAMPKQRVTDNIIMCFMVFLLYLNSFLSWGR